MESNYFRRQLTVAEAENEHMLSDKRLGKEPVLFGFQNKQWLKLVSQFQPGDELWEFCSDQETWDRLMGSAGIALVRDGKIIDVITLRMN